MRGCTFTVNPCNFYGMFVSILYMSLYCLHEFFFVKRERYLFSSWNCEREFSFFVNRDPVPPLHPPFKYQNSNILSTSCPNDAFNDFITLYKAAFERAFPLRSIKIKTKLSGSIIVTQSADLRNRIRTPSPCTCMDLDDISTDSSVGDASPQNFKATLLYDSEDPDTPVWYIVFSSDEDAPLSSGVLGSDVLG